MCSCRVLQKDRSTIPCYWESQPGGCTKPHCVFKHQRDKTYPSTAVQIQHPQRIGQLARCKMNAPFLKRRVSVHVFFTSFSQRSNELASSLSAVSSPIWENECWFLRNQHSFSQILHRRFLGYCHYAWLIRIWLTHSNGLVGAVVYPLPLKKWKSEILAILYRLRVSVTR